MPKDPICGMEIDEKQALKLTKGKEVNFFCSKYCLKRFAEQNKLSEKEIYSTQSR